LHAKNIWIEADGYQRFREAGDPFDATLATRLKAIYSSGDSRDAMELYAAFRGREPTTEALLAQRGLSGGVFQPIEALDAFASGLSAMPKS